MRRLNVDMDESQGDEHPASNGGMGGAGKKSGRAAAAEVEAKGAKQNVSGLRVEIQKLVESGVWEYSEDVNNRWASSNGPQFDQSGQGRPRMGVS